MDRDLSYLTNINNSGDSPEGVGSPTPFSSADYIPLHPVEEGSGSSSSGSSYDLNLQKIKPHNLDLERSLIGAILVDRNTLDDLMPLLPKGVFYSPKHNIIHEVILELSLANQPIDILTVCDSLSSKDKLLDVGGAAYIASLTASVGLNSNAEYYAKKLLEKFILREFIRVSSDINKRAYKSDSDIASLIDYAEKEVFAIAEGTFTKETISVLEAHTNTLKLIKEAAQKKEGITGVPTGFLDLDRVTLGFQPSTLIIIAARPGMGKTAFVLSMAWNIVLEHRLPLAFFTLEMGSEELMLRLMSIDSGIDSKKLKEGRNLTPSEWNILENSPLKDAQLFIDDTPALGIVELTHKARRLKAKHNIRMVVIDYLQLLVGSSDNRGNREQEVAQISRSLKALSKELNIPIIALSQLSRNVESRTGSKIPQLSDLRESGSIEQDADIVAFIHRPEYYGLLEDENGYPTQGVADIIIAKHRSGSTDTVRLRFVKELTKFMNKDDDPSASPIISHPSSLNSNAGYTNGSNFSSNNSADNSSITSNDNSMINEDSSTPAIPVNKGEAPF